MGQSSSTGGADSRIDERDRPAPNLYSQPMLVACACLATGIVLDKFLTVRIEVGVAVCVIALLLFSIAAYFKRSHVACGLLLISITAFGMTWHHFRWHLFLHDDVGLSATNDPVPICLRGKVASTPTWIPAPLPSPLVADPRGDASRMMIRVSEVRNGNSWQAATGKVTVFVNGQLLNVSTGDSVQVIGMLSKPSPPMNPGEFDFSEKYRLQSCLARMFVQHPDSVSIIGRNRWPRFDQPIEFLRVSLDRLLWQNIDDSSAPLASAILLGNRDQIEPTQRRQFMATGTVHLLAISGLHVGILATTFLLPGRLGLVPRSWSLIATIVFVGLYAWVVDFRPPVSRAAILISLYCIGRLIGRQPFSFNSLALAAVMVLAVNPGELFQAGAQLSFLAVATIVVCQSMIFKPPSEDPLDRLILQSRPLYVKAARAMAILSWRTIVVSVAIWIVTTPLVASRFHIIAPSGILLNPLLMIPIWIALLSGFVVLMTGWLMPPVASLAGMICNQSLSLIRSSVDQVEPLPFSHWWLAGPSDFWLAVYYGILAFLFVVPLFKVRKRWLLAFFSAWLAASVIYPAFPNGNADSTKTIVHADEAIPVIESEAPAAALKITAINVEHGTSMLIEYPSGARVLYDGGSLRSPFAASNHIASLLWYKRIDHLDAIIISHADADHYNGIPDLLTKFSVGQIFVSPTMFQDRSHAVNFLEYSITQSAIPIMSIRGGELLKCDGDVTTSVLLPTSDDLKESDNARSVVISIEYQGHRILLPGDLELEGMERLLTTPPVDFDLVMAPHHGSKTGEHQEFAKWATPEMVVISGDETPVPETVRQAYQSARIFNTAELGAIEFTFKGKNVSVGTWSN